MKWLVISDIHFIEKGYDTASMRDALIEKLEDITRESRCFDFILITGDCFFQYDASGDIVTQMGNFIRKIEKACGVKRKNVYICRGNHDVNRKDEKRNKIIEEIIDAGEISSDKKTEELMRFGSELFNSLYRDIKGRNTKYKPFKIFEPSEGEIRIVVIDTCLLSKSDDDAGKLRVMVPALAEIKRQLRSRRDNKINIVMMHHGIEWLQPKDALKFEHWLEDSYIDIIFCGHSHRAAVYILNDIGRSIAQFTCGALFMDDYAIPSFYVCESNRDSISLTMFTYPKNNDGHWVIDSNRLRRFPSGVYEYKLHSNKSKYAFDTFEYNRMACDELIRTLNNNYVSKFGTSKILSSRTDGEEEFDAWKIVGSLTEVGITYSHALKLTCAVVEDLTSDRFSSENILSSYRIKSIIYERILESKSILPDLNDYEIGVCASKYSRRYYSESGFKLIDGERIERLTYSLLKDSIIKDAVVSVTGNEIYYEKIYSTEKIRMANFVMNFIKSLGIFEIHREVLKDLIIEYIIKRPHPWFVGENRENTIRYHIERADKHLNDYDDSSEMKHPMLQIEISYHLCAALLGQYDEYTGCTESSPISILYNSLKRIDHKSDKDLPMIKYQLVQLGKDLEYVGFTLSSLRRIVNVIYLNIVNNKDLTSANTIKALRELRLIINELRRPQEIYNFDERCDTFEYIYNIFKNAVGFTVDKPVGHPRNNAFFVKPHWIESSASNYNLGKRVLVCMITKEEDENTAAENLYYNPFMLSRIVEYLYKQGMNSVHEVVLYKKNLEPFTSREKNAIKMFLQPKRFVQCVFLQQDSFSFVSVEGWRESFYKIIKRSR